MARAEELDRPVDGAAAERFGRCRAGAAVGIDADAQALVAFTVMETPPCSLTMAMASLAPAAALRSMA